MAGRDGFTQKTKEDQAEVAGYKCQRCHQSCKSDGQVAHIKAAAEGGPRFDAGMSKADRRDISNAVYLCPECHREVDTNPERNPTKKLQNMRNY